MIRDHLPRGAGSVPRRATVIFRSVLWAGAIVLLATFTVGLTGCASGSGGSAVTSDAASSYGAPTAEAAVRGFLQALRNHDYPAMARYFGTESGPAEEKWGVEEVEQRMLVLAGILDHDGAELRPSRRTVPDRDQRRFVLSLTGTRYGAVDLPVVAARWREGQWFVERIDTSRLSP